MRPTPTNTGPPHLDVASWEKGFADGFRGRVWWPGPGAEPLSYASGYRQAQIEDDDPRSDRRRYQSETAAFGG
jgi:hypothetical protein